MKKIEKITKYVSNLFDQYSMNDYGYFRDYDEDADETIEVPLFRYGKVDKDTIAKISVNFGITPEEILNTDDCAAMRYWNKYPFFKLYKQYLHLMEWNQKYKDPEPTAQELLFNAIFADKKGISVRYRYDFTSIKERLIWQLKEYDAVMPGVYHEGAEITDLRISTQTMLSFPECPIMIESFLDMTDRLQELFYKAIESELPTDEINEMNFLASWLRACDIVTSDTLITYDNVRCYHEIYKEENLDDFFEYAKIKAFVDSNPWRCQEFFSDAALLQRFVTVFPQAKAKMREFGMELTNFSCEFVWSDAKLIQYSDEEEHEMAAVDQICGLKTISVEERAKERTYIYVNKNRSELYGWGNYIKTLKKTCGPVSKGGIEVPIRLPFTLYNGGFERMDKRITARLGGSNDG